jgi:putative ATPase
VVSMVHLLLSDGTRGDFLFSFLPRTRYMQRIHKKPRVSSSDDTLFTSAEDARLAAHRPLSVRMRPATLDTFVGQSHIIGPNTLLSRAIEADRLTSIILYGPPGTGKTTLAYCISRKTDAQFERLNAVSATVDDIRTVIAAAKNRRVQSGRKTILFIDEIHRFNKAQQDVLMPDVEEGVITLIGATVSNPFFVLTGPLVSRSLVFELRPLLPADIEIVLRRAAVDTERGLGKIPLVLDDDAVLFLATVCDGDARKALNAFEVGCLTTPPDSDGKIHFSVAVAQESIQKKQVLYDRNGDQHYDTASAFIKSMRGSDPDAALYWMAKMIYAGEDPRFIARRMCICAAEDVGLADPQALVIATAAMQASEFIGLPEARIPLAEAAVYIACAPKSNAAYLGIDAALEDVKTNKTQEVPMHLKDSSYPAAKILGHGLGYKYSHSFEGHYVDQQYLSTGTQYYYPTEMGKEKLIKERLEQLRKRKE